MESNDEADYRIDDDSSSSEENSQSLLSGNNDDDGRRKTSPFKSAHACTSVVIDIEEDSEEEVAKEVMVDPDKNIVEGTDSDETDFEENDKTIRKNKCSAKKDDQNSQEVMEVSELDGKTESKSLNEQGQNENDKFESMKSLNEVNKLELQNLKRFSPTDKMFPLVKVSKFHTVTVALTDDFKPGDSFVPYPNKFVPKWNTDFVPMPCCDENVRVIKKRVQPPENTEPPSKPTFTEVTEILWNKINQSLSDPILNCEDIKFAIRSYCKQLRGSDFNVLEYTLSNLMTKQDSNNFFSTVLPGMIHLCLKLPEILTCPLPFLIKNRNYSITLSQKQIASIMANAFFCTFPARFEYEEDFPTINFIDLMTDDDKIKMKSKAQKLRCILHYFERVTAEMPSGLVTFTRKSIKSSNAPEWSKSDKRITKLITLDEGSIEAEGERLLQVDFANRYVGGGVLSRGCVQEEILFVIYPELIVSRLFTERLMPSEALVITGCERYSRYRGYANNFEFVSDFIDCTPWNGWGRKCTQIVAIDALYVSKHAEQFHPQKLAREVNKAYIGFSYPPGTSSNVAVATGKWGCGAFKGDPYLKAVIQMIAASQVDRHVVFFTFGDSRLQRELEEIYVAIKDKTVGQIWSLLNQYYKIFCSRLKPTVNLYEFFTEYTAVSDMQFDDDEMDAEFKIEIPAKKFYKSDSAAPSSSKEKSNDKINAKTGDTVLDDADDDDDFATWLDTYEKQNANLDSSKNTNGKVVLELEDENQALTDEQICALLKGDTPMEEDDVEMTTRSVTPEGSSKSKKPSIPFLKSDAASPSSRKPMLFPKCSSPNSGQMDSSSPTTTKSKSNIPKQQIRQTSLKDFYK